MRTRLARAVDPKQARVVMMINASSIRGRDQTSKVNGIGKSQDETKDTKPYAIGIPIILPPSHANNASDRPSIQNTRDTCQLLAPIARQTPISRCRSSTEPVRVL